jgi:nucleoside-diphosphate-sugar epimerase
MRFHTAINKFVWQACMGLPLTVWRTALHQQRPYLDLVDAIRAIRFFMAERGRQDNQIYNVLTNNITVSFVIDRIRALVPNLQINLVDSRIMNQLSYTVASDKVQRLGFTYEGNLDRALAASVLLLRNARAMP